MNLKQIQHVYFIGIGGIGMSALARYFVLLGKKVSGYDKTPSTITTDLEKLGVVITHIDTLDILTDLSLDKTTTLVVYTPAIQNHKQLSYFNTNNFMVAKRAAVLGAITKDSYCLAVAGTHGKTTTSSILGHLLADSDLQATSFLGGISENYNSNLILRNTTTTVVEADEFDRSFLHLSPDIACVTSMDADHLDIYKQASALEQTFIAFTKQIKQGGILLVKYGLPLKGITYGLEKQADYHIINKKVIDASYAFDIVTPRHGVIKDVRFSLPGNHNLTNALVAFAMGCEAGISPVFLKQKLASFSGVKRRFSYQIKTDNLVYIDDYAHHPTEIDAAYDALQELYPNKKCLVVFQPHLFSRTRDFGVEFAKSLSKFDTVALLDIYPARELPIAGIDTKWILSMMSNNNAKHIDKQQIISFIKQSEASVIMTLGAGDIGLEVASIKKALVPYV